MPTMNIQKLVEQISIQFFGKPFRHLAIWNNRLQSTGGRYHLKTHHIDLNPKVLQKLGEEALIDVIKHELCHYHLHLENKGYRHRDRDFKVLLNRVGGSRYVQWTTEKQAMHLPYHYRCRHCLCDYYRKRRINTQKYVCSKCRGILILMPNKP